MTSVDKWIMAQRELTRICETCNRTGWSLFGGPCPVCRLPPPMTYYNVPREMVAGDIVDAWLWNVNADPGWPIWRFVRRGGIVKTGTPPGTRPPLPRPAPPPAPMPHTTYSELNSRVAAIEREIHWMREKIRILRDRQ